MLLWRVYGRWAKPTKYHDIITIFWKLKEIIETPATFRQTQFVYLPYITWHITWYTIWYITWYIAWYITVLQKLQ